MSPEEIRLACVGLAIDAQSTLTEDVPRRARDFESFVEGEELRLGCLRLAVKSHGTALKDPQARTRRIIEEAEAYFKIVCPEPVNVPAPSLPGKKRGGRSKIPSR